jgi:hypothetical protein
MNLQAGVCPHKGKQSNVTKNAIAAEPLQAERQL